jgi:hypothetical protein
MSTLLDQEVEDLRSLSREEQDRAVRMLLALLDGQRNGIAPRSIHLLGSRSQFGAAPQREIVAGPPPAGPGAVRLFSRSVSLPDPGTLLRGVTTDALDTSVSRAWQMLIYTWQVTDPL